MQLDAERGATTDERRLSVLSEGSDFDEEGDEPLERNIRALSLDRTSSSKSEDTVEDEKSLSRTSSSSSLTFGSSPTPKFVAGALNTDLDRRAFNNRCFIDIGEMAEVRIYHFPRVIYNPARFNSALFRNFKLKLENSEH